MDTQHPVIRNTKREIHFEKKRMVYIDHPKIQIPMEHAEWFINQYDEMSRAIYQVKHLAGQIHLPAEERIELIVKCLIIANDKNRK